MPKLTKRTVDNTDPKPSGDAFVWDEELPGFGLRVKPNGTKSFVLQYRNRNRRSKRMTLGRHGVLTVEQARKEARAKLAEVAQGGDPAESRRSDRDALTIADLCREYLDKTERGLIMTRRGRAKKPSTLSTDRGRIEAHVIPLLGRRTVKDLTSADLRGFIRDVIAGKTVADTKTKPRGRSIVRGGAGAAARTMGVLGAILGYAVEEGYRTDNPARGVVRPAGKKRRIYLDAEQFAAFGRALDRAEHDGKPWQAVQAMRLLALSGCRLGEVVNLKRSECDIRGSCLRLGDSKTGESVRPLGKAALGVLVSTLERTKDGLVFPSRRASKGPYRGLNNAWPAIKSSEPSIASVSAHSLRHAYASVADDLGFTEATIASLIGHAGGGVTRGYIHKLDAALLAAADRVAERIADMMAGATVATAEVIELNRAAAG